MTPSKDHNNFPVMDPKDMKICDTYPIKSSKQLCLGGSLSYRETQKDNSTKSGQQMYKKRKRSLTKRNLKEEPNKNSEAEQYSE